MKNTAALEVVMFTWDTWRSPDSRHPFLWRVLRVLFTTSSRRNGALRAEWGFSVENRGVLLDENPAALEVVMFTWDT